MFTPLLEAAPISVGFARRLDIPIWAVPSMMAAMPGGRPFGRDVEGGVGMLSLEGFRQLRNQFGTEGVGPLDDESVGLDLCCG